MGCSCDGAGGGTPGEVPGRSRGGWDGGVPDPAPDDGLPDVPDVPDVPGAVPARSLDFGSDGNGGGSVLPGGLPGGVVIDFEPAVVRDRADSRLRYS